MLGVGEDGGLKGSRVNQAVNQAEYNSIIVELGESATAHASSFRSVIKFWLGVGGWWRARGVKGEPEYNSVIVEPGGDCHWQYSPPLHTLHLSGQSVIGGGSGGWGENRQLR